MRPGRLRRWLANVLGLPQGFCVTIPTGATLIVPDGTTIEHVWVVGGTFRTTANIGRLAETIKEWNDVDDT